MAIMISGSFQVLLLEFYLFIKFIVFYQFINPEKIYGGDCHMEF